MGFDLRGPKKRSSLKLNLEAKRGLKYKLGSLREQLFKLNLMLPSEKKKTTDVDDYANGV